MQGVVRVTLVTYEVNAVRHPVPETRSTVMSATVYAGLAAAKDHHYNCLLYTSDAADES